jgi:mono/diheme cytochrome c family protein
MGFGSTRKLLCTEVQAVLLVVAVLALAGAASAEGNSKVAAGEATFKAKCVVCHGSDGHSQTTLGKQLKAFDLHTAQVQKQTDEALKNVITNGQGNMPPFQDQLSASQIDEVLSYVRSAFGKKKK